MPLDDRLTEISGELGRLSEELSEVAMDVLRGALSDGGAEAAAAAKALERRLNRARAALERAAGLLEGPVRSDPDDSDG
jgi:hypothetical protein